MQRSRCAAVALFVVGGAAGCSKPKPIVLVQDAAPLNVTPVATASVAKQVNPDNLPAYSGPTGSVEGTISVTGLAATEGGTTFPLCKDGSAAAMYGRSFREGSPDKPGGPRGLADAVVAITGYGSYFVPETKDARQVTIDGCAFSSRTITMTFGQRLDVKNLSDAFWTPELEPRTTAVLMMAVPRGDAVKLYPKREGFYLLGDHDRKWAVADVYVLRHPLHTVTASGGKFRIDGVPVGKVKVNTSHPRLPGTEAAREVEIVADTVVQVDLVLDSHAPPPSAPMDAGTRSSVVK